MTTANTQANLIVMACRISVRALDALSKRRADASVLRPDPMVALSCPTLVLR